LSLIPQSYDHSAIFFGSSTAFPSDFFIAFATSNLQAPRVPYAKPPYLESTAALQAKPVCPGHSGIRLLKFRIGYAIDV